MFRYKKSVAASYERQGYIYFASRCFRQLQPRKQQRIVKLCADCGGEYALALFQFVTTDAGATAICMRHNLSPATLERVVRLYYERFPKAL